jgi:hypothetical protein
VLSLRAADFGENVFAEMLALQQQRSFAFFSSGSNFLATSAYSLLCVLRVSAVNRFG